MTTEITDEEIRHESKEMIAMWYNRHRESINCLVEQSIKIGIQMKTEQYN